MRSFKGPLGVSAIFMVGILIISCVGSDPAKDEEWNRKYKFAKALDSTLYEMHLAKKVEIGTTQRLEITLNFGNGMAKGTILQDTLKSEIRNAGFKVLRLKDESSDRYEDYSL